MNKKQKILACYGNIKTKCIPQVVGCNYYYVIFVLNSCGLYTYRDFAKKKIKKKKIKKLTPIKKKVRVQKKVISSNPPYKRFVPLTYPSGYLGSKDTVTLKLDKHE